MTNAGFDTGSPKTVRAGKASAAGAARTSTCRSRAWATRVNEVVIPLGQKDRFNRTTPDRGAALYGKFVVKPELAAIMNALFKVTLRRTAGRTSCRLCSRDSPG